MNEDEDEAEEEKDVSPDEIEFTQRFTEIRLHEHERPFADVVQDYRRIEEEFVTRAGDSKEVALDFKQRISRLILCAALMADQPHEVCRRIWEEVVDRGFPDHETRHTHTGIYARCCQMNGEFEAGLQVILPLIAEFEEWLKNATLTPELRAYWGGSLATDYKIRDELKAGIRQ